jgi:hypothetical protein
MVQALMDSHRKTREESTPAVGSKLILATVENGKAMTLPPIPRGLGVNGKIIVNGAPHEPFEEPIVL